MSISIFVVNHLLNNPLQYIKGVGPKKSEAFASLGYKSVKQLILHLPLRYLDRRKVTKISDTLDGQMLTQIVRVESVALKYREKKVTKIVCSDDSGLIALVYFNISKQLLAQFQIHTRIVVSGKVLWRNGELQMHHPDVVAPSHRASEVLSIEPVYPSTAKLSSKSIASTIREVIKVLPQIPEWIPQELSDRLQLFSWNEAISIIHQPRDDLDLDRVERAITRLALDELAVEQILLRRAMSCASQSLKPKIESTGALQHSLIKKLPFNLTSDQLLALQEISNDQRSEKHVTRILQGDVGSGKTIVAFLSIMNVVEVGFQGVFMAPTEILARQHYALFCDLLKEHPQIKIALLTSTLKTKERSVVRDEVAAGKVDVIIGTHSLVQQGVKFYKPGIVIIDEQHKFGVKQRLELLDKGLFCDLLMMSATPIPRTLSMVHDYNMNVSTIREKPSGRLPIITSLLSNKKVKTLIESLKKKVEEGEKIYWVCPLIEESEVLSLKNAQERFRSLQQVFGDKVGLVHSKIKDKDLVLKEFASKDSMLRIVVATTVIEVGLDVPSATVMILENAENFGLAQMHQLRGRVGRGEKQSYCVLVYDDKLLSHASRQRIQAMKESNDGFELAEQDLKIRGGGRTTGVQQSGQCGFLIYDAFRHRELLEHAKRLACNHSFCAQESVGILMNIYSEFGAKTDNLNVDAVFSDV